MPSWAAESWNDNSCSDFETVRAVRSPAFEACSIVARSTVTRENSPTTKNALASVNSTNASSANSAVSSAESISPHLAPHSAAPKIPRAAHSPTAPTGPNHGSRYHGHPPRHGHAGRRYRGHSAYHDHSGAQSPWRRRRRGVGAGLPTSGSSLTAQSGQIRPDPQR